MNQMTSQPSAGLRVSSGKSPRCVSITQCVFFNLKTIWGFFGLVTWAIGPTLFCSISVRVYQHYGKATLCSPAACMLCGRLLIIHTQQICDYRSHISSRLCKKATSFWQVCLTSLATDCRLFKSSRRHQERRSSLLPYHPWTWAAWVAWMLCSRSWTLKWWPHMPPCLSPTGPGKTSPPVTLVSDFALLTPFCIVAMCLSSPKHLPGKISPPVTLVSVFAALLTFFCVVSMCLSSPKHLPGKTSPPVTLVSLFALLTLFCVAFMCLSCPKPPACGHAFLLSPGVFEFSVKL